MNKRIVEGSGARVQNHALNGNGVSFSEEGAALRSAELAGFDFDKPDESWIERLREACTTDELGQLGPYELLQSIGHGGQGTVYRARQPGTNRKIAIKRLSAGAFATPTMRARFEREIEAASLLNHPNIVRVYGAEQIEGQNVLAMEWIDGVPINQWSNQQGGGQKALGGSRFADSPSPTASSEMQRPVRQILEVFALVCDAVSCAHQHGVLHRDLKPSNILVDEADQPHVLDFGLAKFAGALEEGDGSHLTAHLTHGSGFMGTPAYASPEQVAGDPALVDARSDIYSLGVILYQMLTGVLPFRDTTSIADLFDAIRRKTPSRPSTLRADINRELDAIVLKSIEKDPQRRYQSVETLAADVRRRLNNETVLAHPPSAVYQAQKFIARHRVIFAAAVAVFITLIGALIGVSAALLQTRSAQEQTRRAQVTANEVNDFLNQMLASADPTVMRGFNVPVSALLNEAVTKLDPPSSALADQAEAEARVRTTIAQAYQSLGLYPEARAQFAAALERGRAAFGPYHLDVANIMVRFADVLRNDEEFGAAERLVDDAERIYLAQVGDQHELTIRARIARARIVNKTDRKPQAQQLLCALLDQAIRLKGGEINDLVIDVRNAIAIVGHCSGDRTQYLGIMQENIDAQRRLYGPDDARIAVTLLNLGAAYHSIRQFAQAEPPLLEALEMRRKLYGEDHPAYATVLYNLANVTRYTQGADLALRQFEQTLAIQERRLAPGHYETARTRLRVGQVLCHLERWEESERMLRKAIDELKEKPLSMALRTNEARRSLAQCLIRQQKFAQAEGVLLEAWHDAETRFKDGEEPSLVSASMLRVYEAWGKPDQAAQWRARQRSYPKNPEAAITPE